jgi:2-oxoglutarate dehydrogenase E2 component (dihydrolipoamide succinyltransferase)
VSTPSPPPPKEEKVGPPPPKAATPQPPPQAPPKAPVESVPAPGSFRSQSPSEVHLPPKSGERRIPMTRLRKRVATRLKDSQNTFALLTTFNEIDMYGLAFHLKYNSDGLSVMLFCKDLFYFQQECSFGYDIEALSIWFCNC